MPGRWKQSLDSILQSGTSDTPRPLLSDSRESNIPGLFVIGDLAGAPVIKMAMSQGEEVIEHLAGLPRPNTDRDDVLDLVIVGAGAAGLNAALAALDKGLSFVVLEKSKIANTIENFPEGKWVYAEPDDVPPKGKLWLDGACKEDLLHRWHQIVEEHKLPVHIEEPLSNLQKDRDGIFQISTPKAAYQARWVVLATGQRGNPRKLGVPGEDQEPIYHRLYSPGVYRDENILVVGGGNSAVEAALTLSQQNRVTLSYRGESFDRIFKDNAERLQEATDDGRITVALQSQVTRFTEDQAELKVRQGNDFEFLPTTFDHAFVLIGAEVPVTFLKSLDLKMENEWSGSLGAAAAMLFTGMAGLWLAGGHAWWNTDAAQTIGMAIATGGLGSLILSGVRGNRYAWLLLSFFIWYGVYGIKTGAGAEFWPFLNWGFDALSFFDRPWSFWYTVMYSLLMTVFGIQALNRWGLQRQDKFQIWRFVSLLAFQWTFFFIIPEFLFQWAVDYQWIGERLANDPAFAEQAWRSYGIIYAWPLFFYTFFYDPHWIWMLWGIVLTFGLIPLLVMFQGKRYCSWICGCGGLAETFGDRWRHLAPKGRASIHWERMNLAVLIFATVVTVGMLAKDVIGLLSGPVNIAMGIYHIGVDVWLVGILPVTLYPFLGGKVWCRYWCPLAKLMQLTSAWFARLGIGRFRINANNKCIACGECSRYCQVGIPVMQYALKQETLDNTTSSCIGCGICVTACPMDTLYFGDTQQPFDLKKMANAS
jgi:NosR/NirI family transcriptional regulator, nitrous oxide reductase regulator